jgi:hypothetical protein
MLPKMYYIRKAHYYIVYIYLNVSGIITTTIFDVSFPNTSCKEKNTLSLQYILHNFVLLIKFLFSELLICMKSTSS